MIHSLHGLCLCLCVWIDVKQSNASSAVSLNPINWNQIICFVSIFLANNPTKHTKKPTTSAKNRSTPINHYKMSIQQKSRATDRFYHLLLTYIQMNSFAFAITWLHRIQLIESVFENLVKYLYLKMYSLCCWFVLAQQFHINPFSWRRFPKRIVENCNKCRINSEASVMVVLMFFPSVQSQFRNYPNRKINSPQSPAEF